MCVISTRDYHRVSGEGGGPKTHKIFYSKMQNLAPFSHRSTLLSSQDISWPTKDFNDFARFQAICDRFLLEANFDIRFLIVANFVTKFLLVDNVEIRFLLVANLRPNFVSSLC